VKSEKSSQCDECTCSLDRKLGDYVKKHLLWIGLAALIVGSISAFSLKNAAESDAFESQLVGAQMGYQWEYTPDYTGMWVAIIIAALGAVAILMHVYGSSQKRDIN
jgi:hypothetical protein